MEGLDAAFWPALARSVLAGASVAGVSLAIGWPLGVRAALTRFPGHRALLTALALPLLLPSFLIAIGLSMLAHEISGFFGTVWAFACLGVPLVACASLAAAHKSTLLRLIANLDSPTAGTIERAPGLRIGMVFQDLALWPNLTALENVALALPDLPRAERRVTAQAALDSCHVSELTARRPGTLSIGQQQRVALARALAAQPHLLLLDEPFSSLDLALKAELLAEVRTQAAARNTAVILVTHDPREARALCPAALVLEDGRVAASGPWNILATHQGSRLLDAWRTED